MKILFLTIGLPDLSKQGGGFYADMIQSLCENGHNVTVIAPTLDDQKPCLHKEGLVNVLRVNIPPIQGNYPTYKKIYGVLMMNPLYKRAYRKYLIKEKFDWVIMPTPPSSLVKVVKLVLKHSGSKFYLLLRDIHPESKLRIPTKETLARTDVYDECKKPYKAGKAMYNYLYHQSQEVYRLADLIGCMTPGNMAFVRKIAPLVPNKKIVLLPNWYKESPVEFDIDEKTIRKKYGLEDKFVAIYGGTIGEGQAIWNIATLAKHYLSNKNIVFLIVGRGVKKAVLEKMAHQDHLTNMMFLNFMPREEYEVLLKTADVGLISIDEKFPVPTSPSKAIGYMALHQPIVAMINKGNDYGDFYLAPSGCGLWSEGLDNEKMFSNFDWIYNHPKERKEMGDAGYKYFLEHFTVEKVCDELCKQLKNV